MREEGIGFVLLGVRIRVENGPHHAFLIMGLKPFNYMGFDCSFSSPVSLIEPNMIPVNPITCIIIYVDIIKHIN